MFLSQPIKTVVDIDTWLTDHVVAGSGCATSKDIYDSFYALVCNTHVMKFMIKSKNYLLRCFVRTLVLMGNVFAK